MTAGVALLAGFVYRQTRAPSAVLPLRVVLDRNRGPAYLAIFVIALGQFAMLLFVTYYCQRTLDFTAIGPAVNLVSRLEGLCRLLGRSVLVTGTVAMETTTALIPLGEHRLRGIAAPCTVFTLPDA